MLKVHPLRKNVIEIANPKPDTAKFTSLDRAVKYLLSGRAEITADNKLHFLKHRKKERMEFFRKLAMRLRNDPESMEFWNKEYNLDLTGHLKEALLFRLKNPNSKFREYPLPLFKE